MLAFVKDCICSHDSFAHKMPWISAPAGAGTEARPGLALGASPGASSGSVAHIRTGTFLSECRKARSMGMRPNLGNMLDLTLYFLTPEDSSRPMPLRRPRSHKAAKALFWFAASILMGVILAQLK